MEEQSKYNEELVEAVRSGKLAIENTDKSKIADLLHHIFPDDTQTVYGTSIYYYKSNYRKGSWADCTKQRDFPNGITGVYPVSDFFAPPSADEAIVSTQEQDIAKEAEELYKRFYTEISEVLVINNVAERRVSKIAKQCALIHCDLMIKEFQQLQFHDELHKNFFLVDGINDYQKLKSIIESL